MKREIDASSKALLVRKAAKEAAKLARRPESHAEVQERIQLGWIREESVT